MKSLKIPLSKISVRDQAIISELIVKVLISSFSQPKKTIHHTLETKGLQGNTLEQ